MSLLEIRQTVTLAWKEWRQIRPLILLPALILLVPVLTRSSVGPYSEPVLSLGAGFLATLLTCYAAGVSSYGQEFSGHTTAYLTTRPISYVKVFAIKVGLSLLLCFAAALASRLQVAPGSAEWAILRSPHFYAWLECWWIIAPAAYLAALLVTLLVREQLLALILALLTTWAVVLAVKQSVILLLLLCPTMGIVCYLAATRRREATW